MSTRLDTVSLESAWTVERAERWWAMHRPLPADARRVAEVLLCAGWFGYSLGKVEQVVQTGGQPPAIERHAAFAAGLADPGEKGQDAAVPVTQLMGVKRDPGRGRLPPQFRLEGTGGGEPLPQFPSSGKPNQEDIVLDPVKRDLVHG